MRVTWAWPNRPDDEPDRNHFEHHGRRGRRTSRAGVEDDTTARPLPQPRHHLERNTRHV